MPNVKSELFPKSISSNPFNPTPVAGIKKAKTIVPLRKVLNKAVAKNNEETAKTKKSKNVTTLSERVLIKGQKVRKVKIKFLYHLLKCF